MAHPLRGQKPLSQEPVANTGPRFGPFRPAVLQNTERIGLCLPDRNDCYPHYNAKNRTGLGSFQSVWLRRGLFALAQNEPALYIPPRRMPHFHAFALFECRGSSFEEMDHAVTSLLSSVSHKRLHYYEHETLGGPGPHGDAATFTVFAEFDVEALTEEKATDLVDGVLDEISTEEIQYFTHGLLSGKPRVHQTSRAASQEELGDQDTEADRRDSRGGRRRGTRGRSRSRAGEREDERSAISDDNSTEVSAEREAEDQDTEIAEPVSEASPTAVVPDDHREGTAPTSPPSVETAEVEDLFALEDPFALDDPFALEEPEPPPARSSSSMQVKTAVTLRASELGQAKNGETGPDQDALLALATAEARRRHPELPADIAPESQMTSLPWGDIVLTLTWSYDVPVPSAAEDR